MPVVQKKQAQMLLFNTIKSIRELEQSGDDAGRLAELREFEDKLRRYMPEGVRQTPAPNELARLKGIPKGAAGNLKAYTFPGLDDKKEESKPAAKPSPKKEEKETSTGLESKQVQPSPKKETPEKAKPKKEEAPPAPKAVGTSPQKEKTASSPAPQKRADVSSSRVATPARPVAYDLKEAEKKLPLDELQRIRRGLQRAQFNNTRLSQGKEGQELEKLQKDRDEIEKRLNSAIAAERMRYESGNIKKPSDWDVNEPKPLTESTVQKEPDKYKAISLDRVPKTFDEIPEQVKTKFAKEPGEPQKDDRQFINNQIRKAANDLASARRELDGLNQSDQANDTRIKELDKQIDKHKERIRNLYKIKPEDVADKWLNQEYKDTLNELKSQMTTAQRKAYKRGEEIDIKQMPNRNAFLRGLRDLQRTNDRINQSLDDEMMWLNASPNNTIEAFRTMDPEERREELDDIKRTNFMTRLGEGIQDYYSQNRTEKDPVLFDQVSDPADQQKWMKRFAASEARKGVPGIGGDDVYKFLFGGGEQFASKYPPELQRPMIRSARRGLAGMERVAQQLEPMARKDPWELIYGDAAPAQRNFATGAGQAPMVPELPQEYSYTPNQQQAPDLQSLLMQGAQQAQPQQQAPNVGQVDQLINSKLENLLKGAQ